MTMPARLPNVVGTANLPAHVGRVLDDGSTQLYTYAYDGFGHVTSKIDPVGRTFSYTYDTNGIDLLEVRQTRAGNNELLSRATYNSQHLPLSVVEPPARPILTSTTRAANSSPKPTRRTKPPPIPTIPTDAGRNRTRRPLIERRA